MDLTITVVGAKDLSLVNGNRKPNTFVRLTVELTHVHDTSVCNNSTEPVWGTDFRLTNIEGSSLLQFQVFHSRFKAFSTFRKTNLGITVIKVDELLERQKWGEDVNLPLTSGFILVRGRRAGDLPLNADEAGPNLIFMALSRVASSLSTMASVVDAISMIHPYIQLSYSLLSVLKVTLKNELNVNAKLLKLVSMMADTYARVEELQRLTDTSPPLQKIIKNILLQTIECSYFIQAYSRQTTLGHLFNPQYDKIEAFYQSFLTLRQSLETGVPLQTAINVTENFQWFGILRAALDPVEMDWSSQRMCLPGTRQDELSTIIQWVGEGNSRNLLWLWGMAGCGKSALSTTLAHFWAQVHRLGAFLFFQHDVQRYSDPSQVFRTLAHQLGSFDSRIARAIQNAIQANPHIIRSSLSLQFRELIHEPLATLPDEGPIVIILDALDECVAGDARSELVSILAREASTLPSFVRIIMTSRDERFIRCLLEDCGNVDIREIGPGQEGDITIYVQDRLKRIRQQHGLAEDWPGPALLDALVKRSGGLFIWAAIACQWINSGYDPHQRIREVVDSEEHFAQVNNSLDVVFARALHAAGPWEDETFCRDFKAIMGLILLVSDPIAPKTIDIILAVNSFQVISRFQSLLHCTGEDDPVSILHISVREYLQDKLRCGDQPWYIDTNHHCAELEKMTTTIKDVFTDD